MKKFYVYKYFFKSSGEVFYISKGTGLRYLEKKKRNEYFKNIVNAYPDDIDVIKIYDNLEENEAFKIEYDLIHYYWNIGQCKANFHEGGRGGNTGNYDSPSRSKKLSDFAKTRIGKLNPMYGKTHTKEAVEKIRKANIGKHLSDEHKAKLKNANTGRIKTPEEIEKIRCKQIGKKNERRIIYQNDECCMYI